MLLLKKKKPTKNIAEVFPLYRFFGLDKEVQAPLSPFISAVITPITALNQGANLSIYQQNAKKMRKFSWYDTLKPQICKFPTLLPHHKI